ncbi:O-antigen ligase family protein [Pelagibacteraceae bacterium]|nr:O-antigen ligase family protein [Pelagibacteraceae bacterium]
MIGIKNIIIKMMLSNISIIKVLFLFLPILLITGPFLSDLAIVIISILFLVQIFKDKNNLFYLTNYFFLFFLIWYSYLIFTSLNSNYMLLSFESTLFYFRYGLFALAIFYLLNKDPSVLNLFPQVLIIIFIVLSVDGIFSFFYGYNFIGIEYGNKNNYRVTSFFGDESILGSYLIRLLPLVFLINQKKLNSNFNKIFFIIFLILVDITIVLTGERAAFFLNILLNFLLIFLINKFRNILIIKNLLCIIIISLLFFVFPQKKERLFDFTLEQFNFKGEVTYIFSKDHHYHYLTAYNMFLDKPLFGHGPKSFRKVCDEQTYVEFNGCSTHPHNTYIQLLAETGTIGFIFIFGIFISINLIFLKQIYYGFKDKINKYNDNLIICLMCLYLNLFPFIPTGSFFNNWMNIIYFIPLGICVYYFKNSFNMYNK